jgi:isopenicillin-N N-acyltransferase like protein
MTCCPRYEKLSLAQAMDKLDVSDVAQKLDEANMGELTVQSMIFEPAALKLHLAIGACPASSLPMKTLELAPLFQSHEQ